MSKKVYRIEGVWTGYGSGRDKVVHREYTTDLARVEAIRKLHSIRYTDGTLLYLTVGHERPDPIDGYTKLINDCIRHGGSNVSVADLP